MHAGDALGTRRSARLVGVPRLLAVVAEIHAASWPLTVQLRTSSTATCYDRIATHQTHRSAAYSQRVHNHTVINCIKKQLLTYGTAVVAIPILTLVLHLFLTIC